MLRVVTRTSSGQAASAPLAVFPTNYDQALRLAQAGVKAALADGVRLIEVEFPCASLVSVSGDGDGQTEMNDTMEYIRRFLNGFRDLSPTTRVFFPDDKELDVARYGQTMDPSAGRVEMDAKFTDGTPGSFQLGYLTKQSAAWAVLGLNLGQKFTPGDMVADSDKLFLVAYPSFNPREELSATERLWKDKGEQEGRSLIIFNGELDRVRGGGYYPAMFFPELDRISKTFLPQFESAFYVHNFKSSSRPGALFRVYPGPWQVLRRNPEDEEDVRVIWTGDNMPSLREVSMEILASGK